MTVLESARDFNWMLNRFVRELAGVTDAVAVSSDGLLMAMSNTLDAEGAEQVAAIIAGFVSLGDGTSRCLDFDGVDQVIVAMKGGYLIVSAMGASGCLGVVATPNCDIGELGYEMAILVERAGDLLTPELVAQLKELVVAP
jgi:predicted regulator of Ras-like GTPase activity (Roadblock/LC7/MglB family)